MKQSVQNIGYERNQMYRFFLFTSIEHIVRCLHICQRPTLVQKYTLNTGNDTDYSINSSFFGVTEQQTRTNNEREVNNHANDLNIYND